ncbi:MAG: molybdopterin-dependent oxidoreductase, partial [Candidatus Thorarchaeota archaeon]
KRNILQLILREHPSACIVCYEWPDCLEYRTESHRSGAITGCNTCPNREFCELREVAELLDIKDLDYQPQYKTVPVEREDPFFDRDYNLCILCARCVRVCDEVRGTSAITFAERGHETRVDTAFGTSHIESGCWFCGACVDVCPTGAITPRMIKWIGTPDKSIESTCALCGVGCQTEIQIKWERVMGTGPGRSTPNYGHMCVLGRFCIPSLVNAPDRLKSPLVKQDGIDVPVDWDAAITEVSRILSEVDPERVGFLGSPQMSSEAAYLFNKLARSGIKSANVDFQGSDFVAFIHKEVQDLARIGTLESLKDFDWILSVGGDFVKTHQPIAKAVYDVVRKGTPLIVLGETGVNLRRWATQHIKAKPKQIPSVLDKLAEHDPKSKKGRRGAILVGPRILELKEPEQVLRAIVKLVGDNGVLFPLFSLGNEAGVIKAGLRPEMLPGPSSVTVKEAKSITEKTWGGGNLSDGLHLVEMREKAQKGELEVLYVADGSIPVKGFEKVPTIIYQSPFPSDWIELAAVILPTTSFVEEDGTFVNLEMKPLKMKATAKAPGIAMQEWQVISDIGKKLGHNGFDYKKVEEVWEELSKFTRNVDTGGLSRRDSWKPISKEENDWHPKYRGATLAERIQDLARFINSLPDRDRLFTDESLDDLVKRLEKKRVEEVSK